MAKIFVAAAIAAAAAGGGAAQAGRGGNWKVVYSNADGPEGRALEVLTERLTPHLLRDHVVATQYVLPMEKDGGERVNGKRDRAAASRSATREAVPTRRFARRSWICRRR